MSYVVSMFFWAKKLIFELWIMLMLTYCTVQYNFVLLSTVKYSFHKNVNFRHVICLFHGSLGQGTHFWTQNDACVYVLYSTVQFCTIICTDKFFLKTVNYMRVLCRFHCFWGHASHFGTKYDNNVDILCRLLYHLPRNSF